MAPTRCWLPPVLLPLAALAAACAVLLALPFRMIEPDDDDYFYGMHAFSTGKVVLTRAEAEKLASIPLADPAKRRPQMVMGIRTSRGFIRERSPGHYALLALFHRAGLDRHANVVLALIAVGFFYYVVRRHVGEGAEVAVLASLLLILNPTFLTMLYRVYMSDFDYFVWATLSLGLYFVARRTGRLWLCAAAGLSLSLSVFFRNTNAIAFLVIGAYEILRWLLDLMARANRLSSETAAEDRSPFGWKQATVVLAFVAIGLVPLAWYGYAITGKLFGQGYQYRLGREGSAYFALWDARAIFSLRHLFLGANRGMMSEGYTLSVGLARLLQGYPLALLAPAGLLVMERRRLRPALFFGLWLALFWGVYLCYRTIRADSFQFMCRKLSPGLAPLALGAAVALGRLPRKARYVAFAAVTLFSLGVTAEFFVQFLGERAGPPGRPPMRGPAGPRRGPRFEPPDVLLQRALERLERGDARGAASQVHAVAEFLADPPPPIRRAAQDLLPRARDLDDALREAAESGEPLSQQQREALVGQLRALQRELNQALPPRPGRGRGPRGRPMFPEPGRRRPPPDDDWRPGRGGPPPFGRGGPALARRLHQLMDEAERRGIDISKAQELDEASKNAFDRGDPEETNRLLRQAIDLLERALGYGRPTRRGGRGRPGDRPGRQDL